MSKFRTAAIVPVKTFSKAKKRLNLEPEKTEIICKLMLEEVLGTISKSDLIEKIALVTKDETAFSIGKRFGCIEIIDEKESGVNNAVALADGYFLNDGFDATIVFPQDIPLMRPDDIQTLFNFKNSQKCVLVVPSRKFDGTNALFRTPVNLMKTHYDEDSYKIHLSTAEEIPASSALVLIRRIMLDVDEISDLQFISKYVKPSISKAIQDL
ncbi:MAG: 2-phospho-L-lactate guanylyltransferase [Nitrosopumilaceae archaeon]